MLKLLQRVNQLKKKTTKEKPMSGNSKAHTH